MHSKIHLALTLLRKYFNFSLIIPKVLLSPKHFSIMVEISYLLWQQKLLLDCQFAQILDEEKLTLVAEKNDLKELKFIQHNCVTSVFHKALTYNSLWEEQTPNQKKSLQRYKTNPIGFCTLRAFSFISFYFLLPCCSSASTSLPSYICYQARSSLEPVSHSYLPGIQSPPF